VRAELSLYKKKVASLEKKQAKLEANLSRVIYPVLTLPFDITSYIFVHCLPAHGRVTPSPFRAPLLLTQVCRYWREVALTTCRLW
ncbi:hypothetical protein C8R45DRAFT_762502, partial [Mycena sanguinolenta]